MAKKFRIPRKIKKHLKKSLWLYPADDEGNSLRATPSKKQEDYTAYKKGVLRNLFDEKNSRKERKEFRDKLNKEVSVPDETLRAYIDDIIRDDLRNSSYYILLEAKKSPKAVIAYYNFVNAYQIHSEGEDSYGNICCMAIEKAEELLREERKRKRK